VEEGGGEEAEARAKLKQILLNEGHEMKERQKGQLLTALKNASFHDLDPDGILGDDMRRFMVHPLCIAYCMQI
jgi:hypothetical protein